MKKILGSLLFLLLFVTPAFSLEMSHYKWSSSASKMSAYVNEPILLKYLCTFSDKNELYTIDFEPQAENKTYEIKLLRDYERIINDKRVNSFEFLLYVKKAGKISFEFDTIMKKTTQESINETIGGRDNDVNKESYDLTPMKQKKLTFNIMQTQTKVSGDLEIRVKKEKTQVEAFEPYHLEIEIKGYANFKNIKNFLFKIEGVKIFSQKPTQKLHLTDNGESGVWVQKFAFVSDKNFTIPAIEFSYFNTKVGKKVNFESQKIGVEVKRASFNPKELLDEKKEKKLLSFKQVLYILGVFICGFLVGKIEWKRKKTIKSENPFSQKIRESHSLQELLMLLIFEDREKYEEIIVQIESKSLQSLQKAKKLSLLMSN